MAFTCDVCQKSFNQETNLTRHKKALHSGQSFKCETCWQSFSRRDALKRHEKKHSQDKSHQCNYCTRRFYRKDKVLEHEAICKYEHWYKQEDGKRNLDEQEGTGEPPKKEQKIDESEIDNSCSGDDSCQETSALEGSLKTFKYKPGKKQKLDLRFTLQRKKNILIRRLEKELASKRGIKWSLNVKVKLVKYKSDGADVFSEPHFRSLCITSVNQHALEQQLQEAHHKVFDAFLAYQREGSGWLLSEVLHLDLNIATYAPIKGSSYIPLPKQLRDKKTILNIKNSNEKCFMWSILAAVHHVDYQSKPERTHHYQQYTNELNFDGIEFPVTINKIPKFEKQNQIGVNVFGFEDRLLFPVYITKERFDVHINLLLYSMGEQRHYCLIRNLNRLLSTQTKHRGRMYHCPHCLHGFVRQNLLEDHQPRCSQHGAQRIELPKEENMFLQFKEFHKQLRVPFVIYADFESLTTKIESASSDPSKSSTEKFQHHQACGFSYVVVSERSDYCQPPVLYRGEHAVEQFLESIVKEEERISNLLKDIVPMQLTPEEELAFQGSTHCHICQEELGTDKVRDHCHITGKFRGAAHNVCNLNYQFTGRVPVILHNLKNYDAHLIMQGLGQIKDKPINCIPNNLEKYISFSLSNLDFIDSLQFMNASLERLVSNLSKEGNTKFNVVKKYIKPELVPLILRKGVYPYDYMDSIERFQETQLPPKEAFYSKLTDEHISNQDYQHALNVFSAFELNNLGDYHDLYLKSDVLLLADVFENFRNICMTYYKLDPAHFYTSPGLAWSACLKMTDVELELLTDPDMYLFIEEGIRGGISMISNRYSKANNPYVPDYNPTQENNYIVYLDANNLYGWGMSQPLPTHDFFWLTENEIRTFDVTSISDDNDDGYILEVDLEYPEELHDLHSDYPLAPGKMKVTPEMLSPYCRELNDELGGTSVPKLIPNLSNKCNYIVHYRNLKLYLALGLKLTRIHRVLAFAQSTWLKRYIDFNTDKRKQASNDFEKDFFKLMNNAVFGKTMENLRRRVNVKLVTNQQKLTKLTSSPAFDTFKIFSEDLAAISMKKTKLYLNRPIYVGFTILDLSKVLMYDFHYHHIKAVYGPRATLLFTDTDSLCYDVKTDDIYQDMRCNLESYDTSEYPRDHPLHSTANKKVIGKMKDETHGIPIQEFVGLRPKMYSILYTENDKSIEKKTAKGISKTVTKRKIRHEDYKTCLLEKKPQMASMNQIRSEHHQLYTMTLNKIGLSPYDDKRYLLDNGVNSVAYGHYSIMN